MAQVLFFTDEDVYGVVARSLRRLGFDAVSTPESGRTGETDGSQVRWATDQGRVLVTFNVAHLAAIHSQWMSQGMHHAGIVVSQQRTIGDLLRRLLNLGSTLGREEMADRLEFLSDW